MDMGGISGSGPTDVWFAAGTALLHWNGLGFEMHSVPDGNVVTALSGGLGDVFAAGAGGKIYRWNGTQWNPFSPQPTTVDLYSIWAIGWK